MAEVYESLRQSADRLEPVAAALLRVPVGGPGHPPALQAEPVRLAGLGQHLASGVPVVNPQRREAVRAICRHMVDLLFQSRGGGPGTRAYQAAEDWLGENTLTPPMGRPGVTLSLVWFVAAAHNWLWWHRNREARLLEEGATTHREQQALLAQHLADDVDAPLAVLHAAPASPHAAAANPQAAPPDPHAAAPNRRAAPIGVGDLIAMHLIGANLHALVAPRGTAHIRVSLEGMAGSVPNKTDPTARLPAPLQSRLRALTTASPVSQLASLGVPHHEPVPVPDESLPWMATLLTSPGGVAVRQWLTSRAGERLVHPHETGARIHAVLDVLDDLDRRLAQADASLGPSVSGYWNAFLGQVLYACIHSMSADNTDQAWSRWAEGYPDTDAADDHCALARLCGRVAYRAESAAQACPGHARGQWTWVWHDLAKVTLRPWLAGHGYATLCLGLWLLDYLSDAERVPRLRMARAVAGLSLGEVVHHWLGAVGVEHRRPEPEEMSGPERQSLLARLDRLRKHLLTLPAVVRIVTEDVDALALVPDPPAPGPGAPGSGQALQPPDAGLESGARMFKFP